jgi:H+/Cl- antiporter ClcA
MAFPEDRHEDKVLLLLTLVIGAVVGLVIVAFILLTENLGTRLYPAGGAAWRRLLVPVIGSLASGFLLHRYFPYARGSGIPQTKAALFLHDGHIGFRTVLGKFGFARPRSPAALRSDAKDPRFTSGPASLPCWVGSSACRRPA